MMVNVGLNDQVCVVLSRVAGAASERVPPCSPPPLSTGPAREAARGGV